MTNHYTIKILKTSTVLKLTYRDKKFKRLEHLRGELNKNMIKEIGRIIPGHEDDLTSFKIEHNGTVTYTDITKVKSLYTQFLDEWDTFYTNFTQLTPKFTGADGNALKSIISYLKQISTDELEALATWKLILEKWHTLNDFHQANTDLKYINSKLNSIIHAIKHQNNTHTTSADGSVQL